LDSETYARELFEECVVHLKERLKEKERLREEEKVNDCIVVSYHLSAVFIACLEFIYAVLYFVLFHSCAFTIGT
jgi:hypothetical protein